MPPGSSHCSRHRLNTSSVRFSYRATTSASGIGMAGSRSSRSRSEPTLNSSSSFPRASTTSGEVTPNCFTSRKARRHTPHRPTPYARTSGMSAHLASTARRLRTRVHILTSPNGPSDLRWGWGGAPSCPAAPSSPTASPTSPTPSSHGHSPQGRRTRRTTHQHLVHPAGSALLRGVRVELAGANVADLLRTHAAGKEGGSHAVVQPLAPRVGGRL